MTNSWAFHLMSIASVGVLSVSFRQRGQIARASMTIRIALAERTP